MERRLSVVERRRGRLMAGEGGGGRLLAMSGLYTFTLSNKGTVVSNMLKKLIHVVTQVTIKRRQGCHFCVSRLYEKSVL